MGMTTWLSCRSKTCCPWVAPYYGRALRAVTDFSIHQFQDRRWVLCTRESVSSAFETVCHDD